MNHHETATLRKPPRANQAFSEVLDGSGADERRTLLHRACDGDARLLEEVDSLLSAHDRVPCDFLETPPTMPEDASSRTSSGRTKTIFSNAKRKDDDSGPVDRAPPLLDRQAAKA